MKKTYVLIPVVLAIIAVYYERIGAIQLREMEDIDLSTLLFVFPIILALVERFNELFVVKKKTDVLTAEAVDKIAKYNFKGSAMMSFTIGILLAIAGFRILENFIVPPSIASQVFENTLFRSLDCILTAAVIAGGTDGWHQIVSLLSDITKAKRDEIKAQKST